MNKTGDDYIPIRGHDHRANISADLPLRLWLYAWLFDPAIPGNYQRTIERWTGMLIIGSLFALLFEQVPAIYQPYETWFRCFNLVSVAWFSLDFVLRCYLAPEDAEFRAARAPRWRYLRSPFAIVDLVAIAPFYLQAYLPVDLRVVRALRLLRIFKFVSQVLPAWRDFQTRNAHRTLRQKVHALVYPSDYGGELHDLFDNFIVFWVAVSVLTVILESIQSVHHLLQLEFLLLDTVAVAIFSVEYGLRLYSCVEEPGHARPLVDRMRQASRTTMVIDLLAIVPFFLEVFLHHFFDLRFLRIFRLMRLLKLSRYTDAMATLTKVIVREWPVLAAAAFVLLLLVILTACLGFLFEHEAQPDKFENIPQTIYWVVITLSSVGYGDMVPVTPLGRAMTVVLALLGIGIFAIPAALLSSAFTDQLRIERGALINELYKMLADGVFSADEADIINREARRLYLSQEELDQLIDKARRERSLMDDVAVLPLETIAANPAHAVEHFKTIVCQIRQLSIMTDRDAFQQLGRDCQRLSAQEWDTWRCITVSPSPPSR